MPLDVDTARALLRLIAETEAAAYTERGRLAEQGIDEPVNGAKARQLYQRAKLAAQSAETIGNLAIKHGPQSLCSHQ